MSPEETQRIHDTSLRILDEIGVRLEHDEIVAMLVKAGARPGTGAQEVRFPPEMVQEYLAMAPEMVTLAARDGSSAMLTPDSPPVFWTNPGLYLWDGTERRNVTAADLAGIARLCDHLGNVQGVMGMAMADVPPPCRDFVGLRVIGENCRKHIRVLCFSPTGMEAIAAMKPLFPGPWFSMGFTAHGPLRWTGLALEIFRRSAGHGIPATINGEPMAGVTGPVSLAGSVAVGNAEILAGIIVNQALEPGRPLIYNLGLAHTFDMRHATAVTGGPENALFARASAAMGRFYRLPSGSWVSTEAVYEDEQAALEKMFGFETHMAEPVGVIWGMGQLESEMTMAPAQLVIDNEMINYIRHYQRGFHVDEESLRFDVIREVGIAGSYLETEDTLCHFREHLFQPALLNRLPRESCPQPLTDAARRRAAEIITADDEEKVPKATSAELRQIEEVYRQRLA
jgi:trimethylamine--corrinoid protein Co-methyltransferase